LREIAQGGHLHLNKPVKAKELMDLIRRCLAQPPPAEKASTRQPAPAGGPRLPTVFVVDDDRAVREAMRDLLQQDGRPVELYASSEAFLEAYRPGRVGCLLVDARMPGMGGLQLLQRLKSEGTRPPAIMITGQGDVPMAVEAMRAGATDFIEKPVGRGELFASIERVLEHTGDSAKLSALRETAATRLTGLTARQRQIMELVLAGHPSKNIAADLGISQRTVENHRAAVMKKTGSHLLSALIRLVLAAGPGHRGAISRLSDSTAQLVERILGADPKVTPSLDQRAATFQHFRAPLKNNTQITISIMHGRYFRIVHQRLAYSSLARCQNPCCSQEDMVMDRFDFSPLFRSTIGFDRLTRLVDAATRVDSASLAYPPYNIEKTGEDAYRLTMAVAGFSPAELDITVQENTLLVTGKAQKEDENGGAYLHRGIARRTFERRFSLADHMKVVGASLDNGLLYVDVVREVPEAAKPRTIEIGTAVESVQPQVTAQKAA
jgi:FixJ family two-component response regulator/HSP20 family molecular chaperone IbpA